MSHLIQKIRSFYSDMDFVIDLWLRREEDDRSSSQELLKMPMVHSKCNNLGYMPNPARFT